MVKSERLWLQFAFILVLFHVKYSDAEFEPSKSFDLFGFEQVKQNIFGKSIRNEIENENINKINVECLEQLEVIKRGLLNSQMWAIKILDAWGKVPSGILEGNLYELGAFSECFHINREGELYKTRYCMGQFVFDLDAILGNKSSKYNTDTFFSNVSQLDENFQIVPRMIAPQPKSGSAILFGLCVPAACRMDFLQEHFKIDQINYKNISINLLENSCQNEENVSSMTTLDWITTGLLAIVLILILISTSYDIFCTLYDREKSRALLAFSFYTNGMKLLSYRKSNSPDMMHCLHGIRVISTAWVVLGHTYFMHSKLPVRNKAIVPTLLSRYHKTIIFSALIAVDTFFVLSGLLISINMLKHLEKTKGRLNVLVLYFHRYLRLTPLLGISILFSISLLKFLGSGPLWPSTLETLSQRCERNWWSTLLYVQNYVNPKEICFDHSWYLSVDMQLFVISPLIMYLIYRFDVKALFGMVLLIIGCVGCTVAIHVKYGLKSFITTKGKMETAYIPTHVRYSPWLIGVIAGYILFKARNRRIRIPRTINLIAWALSLAVMVGVIFGNYPLLQMDSTNTPLEYGLYDGLSRIGWAIALCYIIFACCHDSGGPINWFLGHELWQPTSRICYSVYLLHFPVLLITMGTIQDSPFFTELKAFHTFIGNYVFTLVVSTIATLAFESPIVVMEKILFSPKKKSNSEKNAAKEGANPN